MLLGFAMQEVDTLESILSSSTRGEYESIKITLAKFTFTFANSFISVTVFASLSIG